MSFRFLICMTVLGIPGLHAQETVYPETVFGKHLQHIVAAIKQPTQRHLEALVRDHFDPEIRDAFPMEEHIAYFKGLAEDLGDFEVLGVSDQIPDQLYLDVKPAHGDPRRFLVEFNPNPPHGMIGIQPVPYIDMAAFQVDDLAKLHRTLADLAGDNQFSGALYFEEDGIPSFSAAYGYANKRYRVENHVDTPFNTGSITKQFTKLAVLLLIQEGTIGFEDTIGAYFPDFPAEKKAITILQLLRHESGLTEYWDSPIYQSLHYRIDNVTDYAAIIKDMPLVFKPGTARRYSNAGYNLLGIIVQKASKQNYYDFMRQRIFQPLGMLATDFYQTTLADAPIAVGYTNLSPRGPQRGYLRENTFVLDPIGPPSGGSYSTLTDLVRYERQMLENKLLDTKHTAIYFNIGQAKSIQEAAKMPIPKVLSAAGGSPGISALTISDRDLGIRLVILSNYDERLAEDIGVALFRKLRAKHTKDKD